ncbi:restriction endonuclease subunit S [Vibrio lentus]|uniref:restriction endonuclease subunit S n=1 Tax=Vibrio lentus TaxID=136468 RepID=UPI00101ADAA9|nr:restriction endonuclease subunit S [Vibrio lentus]MCC4817241.1 restriction endonuclease subunit S [Vibrio lentus]
MSQVIPEGWALAKLDELISHSGVISDGDWVESKDQDSQGSIRLIQLADIGDGEFLNKSNRFMNVASAQKLNCTFLKENDVLIARMPDPLGRACLFPKIANEAVTVVDVCLIRLDDAAGISPNLLMHWINSSVIRNMIALEATGTTRKRITRKKLSYFDFPIPSQAEQKVIADKLDELLAQVESTKARLDAVPAILKSFRQSVLADAVSGKLTAEWRDGKKLNAENDLKCELSLNDGKKRKIEATSSHELVSDNFSTSWSISKFDELYRFIDYRGKTPKKSEYGKRLYTAKNIKMGYLSNEPVEYLSEEDYESWMTRGFSKMNDIFFVTEGHTMGCVAINTIGSDIALAQRTLTLQPYGNVRTKFHYYFMLTNSFQKLVDLNATGTAAKGIKASKFRGLPLPFPAYEEQTEIVRRVEELFAFADKVEAEVNAAQTRVNNLTQSILAKAFRGELTADWRAANPELITGENSAEALIERIKAEREALALASKAAKKKPSKKIRAKKVVAKESHNTLINRNLSPVQSLIADGVAHNPQDIFNKLTPDLSLTEVFNEISELLRDDKIEEKTVDGITGFFIK